MPSSRDLLDDLHRRRALAEQGGGEVRIAQQHKKGKLTRGNGSTCCSIRAPSSSWTASSPTAPRTSALPTS